MRSNAYVARDPGDMQMPEPHAPSRSLWPADATNSAAFERRLIVLLPSRRYRRRAVPSATAGSPTIIELGEETRFGDELMVSRTTPQEVLNLVELAEMTG